MKIKPFKEKYHENIDKIDRLNKELAEEINNIDELHEVLADLKNQELLLADKIKERRDYVELYEKINNTFEPLHPDLEKDRALGAVNSVDVTGRSDKVKDVSVGQFKGSREDYVHDKSVPEELGSEGLLFKIKGSGRNGRTYDSNIVLEDESFRVLAGSLISSVVGDYPSNNSLTLRELNKDKIGEDFILTADVTFHNLYSVSTFILGYNSKNGSTLAVEQKTGLTYRDYFKEED